MTNTASILVIGATGKVGSRVLAKLNASDHSARGVSRQSTPAFDWTDESGWPAALAGAETAFVTFVPDLAAEGAPETIQRFTQAAAAAGIKRLVLLSGRGETNAIRSENVLLAAGAENTVIRASWFNQNFSEGHLLSSVLGGFVALPAHDRLEPFIDVDDIADVAVAALTQPGHGGELYEVTGPRLMTFADAVAEISAASGRPVAYAHVTLDDFYAALVPEVGADMADLLRRLCAEVFDGRNEHLGDGVQRALGRAPGDFSDFVREISATGLWSATEAA